METKVKQYININEILSRLLRNPILEGTTKEQVIQYVVDFISIAGVGFPMEDREDVIEIKDYRGLIPCDVITLYSVKEECKNINLKAMTNEYLPKKDKPYFDNKSFRVQGRIIYTSLKEGTIRIAYKTIKTDGDGFPMLIDNPMFLIALENYIKVQVFTILFEQGKLQANVLQNAEKNYYLAASKYRVYVKMPSIAEMESIKNSLCTLVQRTNEFKNSFETLGEQEFIRTH